MSQQVKEEQQVDFDESKKTIIPEVIVSLLALAVMAFVATQGIKAADRRFIETQTKSVTLSGN